MFCQVDLVAWKNVQHQNRDNRDGTTEMKKSLLKITHLSITWDGNLQEN